jgi:hypothetical protein
VEAGRGAGDVEAAQPDQQQRRQPVQEQQWQADEMATDGSSDGGEEVGDEQAEMDGVGLQPTSKRKRSDPE